MKSQYPSSRPVEFDETVDGVLSMWEHDRLWAEGSGYIEEGPPVDDTPETRRLAEDYLRQIHVAKCPPDETVAEFELRTAGDGQILSHQSDERLMWGR